MIHGPLKGSPLRNRKMNAQALLAVFVLMSAPSGVVCSASGLASESGGYKVAAYFGDPKYVYCTTVQWTRSSVPLTQEFILVNGQGWISYFEFTERVKGESNEVLSPKLVTVTSEHHAIVGESEVRGIASALRALVQPERLPRRLAYPSESVVVSGGVISVAYKPEELVDWDRGLVELREAMRSKSKAEAIGKICTSYWGDKSFSVNAPPPVSE